MVSCVVGGKKVMTPNTRAHHVIRELATLLGYRETSPVKRAACVLRQLKRNSNRLNAILTLTPVCARGEGRCAEVDATAGIERSSFHGILNSVRGLLAAAGCPTAWGEELLRQQCFSEDATAVARVRQARAIRVATTKPAVELVGGMGYEQPHAPSIIPWNVNARSGDSSTRFTAAVTGHLGLFITETRGSIIVAASSCGATRPYSTDKGRSRPGAMSLSWTLDKIGLLAQSLAHGAPMLATVARPKPLDSATILQVRSNARESKRRQRFWRSAPATTLELAEHEGVANVPTPLAVLSKFAMLEPIARCNRPSSKVICLVLNAKVTPVLEELMALGVRHRLTEPKDRVGDAVVLTIPAVVGLRVWRSGCTVREKCASLLALNDVVVLPCMLVIANSLGSRLGASAGMTQRILLSAARNLIELPTTSVSKGSGECGFVTRPQIVGPIGENTPCAVARPYQAHTEWQRHRRFFVVI